MVVTREEAEKRGRCFVLTVSDTRDETTDTSGQLIKSQMAAEGHQLAGYKIVKDEPVEIERLLDGRWPIPKSRRSSSMAVRGFPARWDLRGDRQAARQKARRLRRDLSLSELSGHRFGGDHEPGGRRLGARKSPDFAAGFPGRGDLGDGEIDLPEIAPHGFAAPGKMKVHVKLFAILRERAGTADVIRNLAKARRWASSGTGYKKSIPSSRRRGFGCSTPLTRITSTWTRNSATATKWYFSRR